MFDVYITDFKRKTQSCISSVFMMTLSITMSFHRRRTNHNLENGALIYILSVPEFFFSGGTFTSVCVKRSTSL